MTFGTQCMQYKDEIKHALNNEVIGWYNDDGDPIYVKAEKKETTEVILNIFDEIVHQGLSDLTSGRALDRLYKEKTGQEPDLHEYMKILQEEALKFDDYRCEGESPKGQILQFPGN